MDNNAAESLQELNRAAIGRFEQETVSLRVDKDPAHYIEGISPDDPRRFANDTCVVCGLLAEYQTKPEHLYVYFDGNNTCNHMLVCSEACKKRYGDLSNLMDMMYERSYRPNSGVAQSAQSALGNICGKMFKEEEASSTAYQRVSEENSLADACKVAIRAANIVLEDKDKE